MTGLSAGPVTVIPMLLLADDPAAVKAEVTLRLSDTVELDLSQVRGPDTPPEERNEWTRERLFLFCIPVPKNSWSEKTTRLQQLWETSAYSGASQAEFPAEIRLYDASGRLLEEREYVIRSRVNE